MYPGSDLMITSGICIILVVSVVMMENMFLMMEKCYHGIAMFAIQSFPNNSRKKACECH